MKFKLKMRTKTENTNTSQLDKANAALVALAPNVISDDRKDAPYSEVTVVAYLKGRGKDLKTAITLLAFFRERIALRDKLIAA
jgi:hypothetical protein